MITKNKMKILYEWITKKCSNDLRFIKQSLKEKKRKILPVEKTIDYHNWDKSINLCWIGHSTILINFKGIWIITDPVFSDIVGISIAGIFKIGAKRYIKPAIKITDLPNLDLLMISHAHMDHLDVPTLKKINNNVQIITSKNTKDIYPKGKKILELDWEESYKFNKNGLEVNIKAFEVNHPGARMRFDTHRKSNGYLIYDSSFSIVFLGDTAFSEDFIKLKKEKNYDLIIAPIGAYNPWIDKHCNPEQALAIADMIGSNYVIPIHHSTFKLSDEEITEPLNIFSNTSSNSKKICWTVGEEIEFKV